MKIAHRLIGLLSAAAVVSVAGSARANLLNNGSFETGNIPTPDGTTLTAGSTGLTGWVVGGHGIDYISSYWQAGQGARSVDLDSGTILGAGPYDGSVAQTFDTVVGKAYRVTFLMAGNPDGAPTLKSLQLSAAGQSATLSFLNSTQTRSAMGYQQRTFDFTANAAQATLLFQSLSGTGYGAVIDNVDVSVLPEPVAPTLAAAVGGLALSRRPRHRLA